MPARRKTTAADTIRAQDGLENLVTGQGGQKDSRYYGARSFKYRKRTAQELSDIYRSNWLCGQVVDIPAFEMTRERREIELEDPKKAADIRKVESALNLWERVKEAIQWSDLFGGAGLLLGVDGAGDWMEPLVPERVQLGALKWIHAVEAGALIPELGINTQLIIDPTSPQFMQPEFYQVVGAANLQRVHYSRVIRFPGLSLPWRELQSTLWWGGSRVERAFDAIADDEQVSGGVVDLITESKIDVYGIKNLMSMLSAPGGEDRVRKRIALADSLKSIYQGIIIDAEEEYTQKESQIVQGMANIMGKFLERVAAASGIPVTRLLGTSAKGLNATGEGDLTNFYDMIDGRRETYLRPRLEQLDEILVRSAIGEIPEGFAWSFGPLWQMSETDVAAVDYQRAQAAQIYVTIGAIDPTIVARQLKQDGTYVGVDDAWIKEVEEMVESMPDPNDPDPNAPDPNADPTAKADPKAAAKS